MRERCKSYVGISCVNGMCPMITEDDFGDYRNPLVDSCDECSLYEGCEDCALLGTEHCDDKAVEE